MVPPTVTVSIVQAMNWAFERAKKTGRTQQIELGEDLYARVSVKESRRFLLFQLENTPPEMYGHDLARALGFENYQLGWHQGKTLTSLTVIESS